MYIAGNEITVTWVLAPTDTPLSASDYDIKVIPSDLNGTYTDAGIINYVAPSEFFSGSMTYSFTPLTVNRFQLWLTTGTGASYTILDEKNFWVFGASPTSVACTRALGALSRPGAYADAPPLNITKSTTFWRDIYAVGKHATDSNKLVFVGVPAFGEPLAIGVLDRTTGIITEVTDAFNGTTVTGAKGIDCDPVSGVYVVSQSNSSGGFYRAYWSTDLTTWTEITYSGWNTQFHGGGEIRYDSNQKLWWLMDDVGTYSSTDGKTFNLQNMEYAPLSSSAMATVKGFLHSGQLTDYPETSFFAGNTENPITCRNEGLEASPIVYTKILSGLDPLGKIFSAGNPALFGGVATNGSVVVMSTPSGWMVYSTTGLKNSWVQCAAPAANTPVSGPENEWIDGTVGGTMGNGLLIHINGTWWAPKGTGGPGDWWKYVGDIPIGSGWAQDDTGPLGTVEVTSTLLRDPNACRLAYSGYDTTAQEEYIFFDNGDL